MRSDEENINHSIKLENSDFITAQNKLRNFRKKMFFFNFLKKLKLSTENKYASINIYYFSVKSGLKAFIDNISRIMKEHHLYKLLITWNFRHNCLLFFSNIKKKIHYIKYRRNREKYKFKQGREFYARKLKNKIFSTLKINKNLRNQYLMLRYTLDRKFSNYLSKKLVYVMKKFSKFSNSNFHNLMIRKFIFRTVFKKFLEFYKFEEKCAESDRIIRKFSFVNSTKKFIQKIKKLYTKKKSHFFLNYQKFFLNKFKNSIIKNKYFTYEYFRIDNSQRKHSLKLFFKYSKRRIQFIKSNEPKFNNLFQIFDKLLRKKFYKNFENYDNYVISNKERLEVIFTKRIFLKKIKFQFFDRTEYLKKFEKLKNSEIFKNQKKEAKLQLILNLKLTLSKNSKYNKAVQFYDKNKKTKTFFKLHEIKNILLEKKQKYILSLLMFNKTYIRKAFKLLKTNFIIKKNKKEEYKVLKSQRDKIINSHLFRLLVMNLASEIKNKEDQIARVFIKRTSRGISTALQFIKKLKSRVEIKKLINTNLILDNNKEKNERIVAKINCEIPNFKKETIINVVKEKIEKDVDLLISLKNKRRALPKKFEYN